MSDPYEEGFTAANTAVELDKKKNPREAFQHYVKDNSQVRKESAKKRVDDLLKRAEVIKKQVPSGPPAAEQPSIIGFNPSNPFLPSVPSSTPTHSRPSVLAIQPQPAAPPMAIDSQIPRLLPTWWQKATEEVNAAVKYDKENKINTALQHYKKAIEWLMKTVSVMDRAECIKFTLFPPKLPSGRLDPKPIIQKPIPTLAAADLSNLLIQTAQRPRSLSSSVPSVPTAPTVPTVPTSQIPATQMPIPQMPAPPTDNQDVNAAAQLFATLPSIPSKMPSPVPFSTPKVEHVTCDVYNTEWVTEPQYVAQIAKCRNAMGLDCPGLTIPSFQKFIVPEILPNVASVWSDPRGNPFLPSSSGGVSWVRPHAAIGSDVALTTFDARQSAEPVCIPQLPTLDRDGLPVSRPPLEQDVPSWLSLPSTYTMRQACLAVSMEACTALERHSGNMIISDAVMWKAGRFTLRAFINGKSKPLFMTSSIGPEVWPGAVEKVMCSLYGGYSGSPIPSRDTLVALTGWVPERLDIQPRSTDPLAPKDPAMDRLHSAVTKSTGIAVMAACRTTTGLPSWACLAVINSRIIKSTNEVLVAGPKRWLQAAVGIGKFRSLASESGSEGSDGVPRMSGEMMTAWLNWEQIQSVFSAVDIVWTPSRFSACRSGLMETVSWSSVSDNDDGILTTMPQWKVETSAPSPTKIWVLLEAHLPPIGFGPDHDRCSVLGPLVGLKAFTHKRGRRVTGSERSIASQSPLNSRFILLPLNIPQGTSHTVVSADLRAPEFSSTFKADLDSTNEMFAFKQPSGTFNVSLSALSPLGSVTVHPVPFATEGGISRIHSEWSESCCGGIGSFSTLNPHFFVPIPAQTSITIELDSPSVPVELTVYKTSKIVLISQEFNPSDKNSVIKHWPRGESIKLPPTAWLSRPVQSSSWPESNHCGPARRVAISSAVDRGGLVVTVASPTESHFGPFSITIRWGLRESPQICEMPYSGPSIQLTRRSQSVSSDLLPQVVKLQAVIRGFLVRRNADVLSLLSVASGLAAVKKAETMRKLALNDCRQCTARSAPTETMLDYGGLLARAERVVMETKVSQVLTIYNGHHDTHDMLQALKPDWEQVVALSGVAMPSNSELESRLKSIEQARIYSIQHPALIPQASTTPLMQPVFDDDLPSFPSIPSVSAQAPPVSYPQQPSYPMPPQTSYPPNPAPQTSYNQAYPAPPMYGQPPAFQVHDGPYQTAPGLPPQYSSPHLQDTGYSSQPAYQPHPGFQ